LSSIAVAHAACMQSIAKQFSQLPRWRLAQPQQKTDSRMARLCRATVRGSSVSGSSVADVDRTLWVRCGTVVIIVVGPSTVDQLIAFTIVVSLCSRQAQSAMY
jgi:hypothetical protein